MNAQISEKVVEKIKQEHLSPKPKWRFQLGRMLVFFLLALFFVIGSIAVGLVLELFDELELDSVISRPAGFRMAVGSFPYFWLIVFIIFIALALLDFFHTKYGYRHRTRSMVLVFVGGMLALGVVVYTLGISENLHRFLGKNVRYYPLVISNPEAFWSQPDEGLLSGVIISDDKDCGCMKVVDWQRSVWNVDYSRAIIRPGAHIQDGEGVKIIGREKEPHKFQAQEIGPWKRNFMKVIRGIDKECDEIYKNLRQGMGVGEMKTN